MSEQAEPRFITQKIYTKDTSLEALNALNAFKTSWAPTIDVNVDTKNSILDKNIYEVDLTLTVTAKNEEANAYLIQITQTGIFTLENMADDQIDAMLNAYCPTTLFPFIKEAISGIITRAGFPPLSLSPINFDALYMQRISQNQEKQ